MMDRIKLILSVAIIIFLFPLLFIIDFIYDIRDWLRGYSDFEYGTISKVIDNMQPGDVIILGTIRRQ